MKANNKEPFSTARIGKINYKTVFRCLIVAFLVWGTLIEPRLTVVREMNIEYADGPCQPIRLAVLGDFHVGSPHVTLERLAKIVKQINDSRPELILLLGDYVSMGGTEIAPEPIAKILSELKAPLGVVSVLGNHDWWLDGHRVRKALEGGGIVVLENDKFRINLPCGPFWVAGLADDTTRMPLPELVLEDIPNGETIIMIAHDPANFLETPDRSLIYLAAHTHGGQVYLPLFGALFVQGRAPRRYAYGIIEEGNKVMYVTGGIGTSILPIRFNMPPEVVFMTVGRSQ